MVSRSPCRGCPRLAPAPVSHLTSLLSDSDSGSVTPLRGQGNPCPPLSTLPLSPAESISHQPSSHLTGVTQEHSHTMEAASKLVKQRSMEALNSIRLDTTKLVMVTVTGDSSTGPTSRRSSASSNIVHGVQSRKVGLIEDLKPD